MEEGENNTTQTEEEMIPHRPKGDHCCWRKRSPICVPLEGGGLALSLWVWWVRALFGFHGGERRRRERDFKGLFGGRGGPDGILI